MKHPTIPYQIEDFFLHDYKMYSVDGLPNMFRGPQPPKLISDKNIAFFGTAHTFGCLSDYPYPSLLSAMLHGFALNLAVPGASPDWYLRNSRAVDLANASQLLVMQVLPARNTSNRLLTNEPNLNGIRFRAEAKSGGHHAFEVYREIIKLPRDEIDALVKETRDNYVSSHQELASRIKVPKILLWFSDSSPDRPTGYDSPRNLFGGFPQLVNRDCVDRLKSSFDLYVEVVSNVGFPAPFRSRFTGEDVIIDRPDGKHGMNSYYPSQAMHVLAAQKVYDAIKAQKLV